MLTQRPSSAKGRPIPSQMSLHKVFYLEDMKELLDSLNANFDDAESWIRLVDPDWIADVRVLT
jgi:hypothetical protein